MLRCKKQIPDQSENGENRKETKVCIGTRQ